MNKKMERKRMERAACHIGNGPSQDGPRLLPLERRFNIRLGRNTL